MPPGQEPMSLVARRSRGWGATRSTLLHAAAATAVAVQLLVVGIESTTAVVPAARVPLVFRVEGSRKDPEFIRACGVVKGLEELYGKDRYTLHSIETEVTAQPCPRTLRRWIPCWSSAKKKKLDLKPAVHRGVLCSIDRPPVLGETQGGVSGAGGGGALGGEDFSVGATVDTSVAIGGVEDLLEFVRSSVLAGPRPSSFAFHERSLRIQHEHGKKRVGPSPPAPIPQQLETPPMLRNLRSSPGVSSATTVTNSGGIGPEKTGAGAGVGVGVGVGGDVGVGADAGVGAGVGADASAAEEVEYDYDLVVVGGGSGGLACAKEAARLGQRVACLDFVKPSAMGSKWGLGGTCVNVGCIPKKLMHQASLLGGQVEDARVFGWRARPKDAEVGEGATGEEWSAHYHDWASMVQSVQNYIKGLNFKYRSDLRSKGVEYVNALGRLQDKHTVIATDKHGKERAMSCGNVVIAVGGRPKELACEGGELAMTSDDIFSLKTPPGKTLVVGASYVALECAGFLTGLGIDATVMVRSILLRGFDQGIAERIGRFMEADGTRFLRPALNIKLSPPPFLCWTLLQEFDTVLAATGRAADVQGLGLENLGVALSRGGKIVCTNEETTVPGVFGIGDAVEGVPELTPSAIQAGRLLARRLFGGSASAMDYSNVCTTVFTPLEYGCCGLSEEEAIDKLGEDNVEVFHSAFTPLEWQLNSERPQNACYVKAVCDLTDRQRVVGLHFLGPNAGEVMQGFGLGIRLGMTYEDLRQLVGIHPTVAEEITLLEITRRSGHPIEKSGC
eukprot:jgi/Undpi1/3893/HiC_scaffold_16.g07261.m1